MHLEPQRGETSPRFDEMFLICRADATSNPFRNDQQVTSQTQRPDPSA